MSGAVPRVPQLPRWERPLRGAPAQRVSLSGFLIAPGLSQADAISDLVAGHLASCRAAPGCLRAEIWRSQFDPVRFAIFIRFRSRADWEAYSTAARGSDWSRATGHLCGGLRLHPE